MKELKYNELDKKQLEQINGGGPLGAVVGGIVGAAVGFSVGVFYSVATGADIKKQGKTYVMV